MDTSKFLENVRQYLRTNEEHILNDWLELVKQPSVSATGEGVEECCEMIKQHMESLDIQVTKYPVEPYPVLVGRYGDDPGKKTVLIYAHYDVKPAGDLSQWKSNPFVPDIRDGKVYARGSADNKSPLMAHLKALEYFRKEKRSVPVNLIFLFEGCEEEGSTGLPEFLKKNKSDLKADLVFFSDGPKDPSGLPIIALGAKGDLTVKIIVQTMNRNVHARYAPVLPSAAWRLIEVLNLLRKGDKVMIPGFYEDIIPLTEEELRIMQGLPESEQQLNAMYEAENSNYGMDFYPRLLGMPTFNICWIKTGANGVVPAKAEALIDIRLVPGQNPEKIFEKVKKFVDSMGYPGVTVEMDGFIEPSKTSIDTPYLPIVEEATRAVYGKYVTYSCRPSSAPDYLWTNILKLPAIQVRWSDADSDNHAPNEHLSIKEYFDGIALTTMVLQAVSQMQN